jgi:ATP-dependent helicase/nuclease subunit B
VALLSRAEAFVRAVEGSGPLTKYDGLVRAKEYWNAVAGLGLSPTALERLAECPFRYFAAQMLDLEELEEPEGEESLSNLEIGSLYHEVLEKFRRGSDLEKALAEAFAAFEGKRTIRYPVLWEVEKERISETLATFTASENLTEFKPREFEKALRAELALEVGGRKTVAFRGFVDRIDAGPDGVFRIVDYKKSRGKYGSTMETGIFKKGWLQAPIYLLLAEKVLGGATPAKALFAYYFIEALVAGEKWELSLDGAFFGRRAEFEAQLRGLLETIPRGEFPIRPGEHCRSCEFGTVCRKSHGPTLRRAGAHEELREKSAAR